MPFYAEKLADFAYAIRSDLEKIPKDVQSKAAERLLDNFGCMLFGLSVEPAFKTIQVEHEMGVGRCSVIGFERPTSPTAAAFALGTLAQSFELNDLGVYVHPGACVIPAALAALDHGDKPISGQLFLASIVAGYEVMVRLSECVGPSAELDVGWHTPSFHGAIGASVTAGMLLNLNAATLAQAIVIAADLAGGGLMLARLGTDVKRMHCGRGAQTGIFAVLMAAHGMKSRLDTFENETWGYCRTITGGTNNFNLNEMDVALGKEYIAFDRTGLKYYPVGAEVLGAIDSITLLKNKHQLIPSNIEKIIVGTPAFFYKAQGHEFPTSPSQIHFNMEYGVAMAMTHTILPVYEDSAVLSQWLQGYKNPEVAEMALRVSHVVDEDLEKKNPYGIDSKTTIYLTSGTKLETQSSYVAKALSLGSMKFSPMQSDKIMGKFSSLTQAFFTKKESADLGQRILDIGRLSDVSELWRDIYQQSLNRVALRD